jgi:hypothetical protein
MNELRESGNVTFLPPAVPKPVHFKMYMTDYEGRHF